MLHGKTYFMFHVLVVKNDPFCSVGGQPVQCPRGCSWKAIHLVCCLFFTDFGSRFKVGWAWGAPNKMLSDPGNCPHCFSPASHWLNPSWSWPAKQGKPIFRKVVEVAAKYKQYIGRDHEEKREWLGSQTAYNLAQREAGGVHLFFNSLPGKILPHVSSHQALPEDTVAHFTDTKTNVVCSQYRLQQLEEGILSSWYPTPPAAPPKDCYIYQ